MLGLQELESLDTTFLESISLIQSDPVKQNNKAVLF